MTRRGNRARTPEDDDTDIVVGLRFEERLVEFDQQAAALRIAALDSVQHDAGNATVVQGLVGDVLV